MKPGRDQKRALQWLSQEPMFCFEAGRPFECRNGSAANPLMQGLAHRGWAQIEREYAGIRPKWKAEITDAGRKALEDAP